MTERTGRAAAGEPRARRGTAMPSARRGFNLRETLIAIVISFTMAFVFRGFVIEGFLIPTGSMAPTLLGKHMRIRDADSGYEWTVGPWDYAPTPMGPAPLPAQGTARAPVSVNDPMTGTTIERVGEPLRAGDRLFVLKYLAGVYDPSRWEVVVFKAPHVEPQNYIKRLVGMPGEQVALVDGDVFSTPWSPGSDASAWDAAGWTIARKPERVQRAVWQPVFDSTFTPDPASQEKVPPSERFSPPWRAEGSGWSGLRDAASYTYEGSGATSLTWDSARYPIDDYTSYNQLREQPQRWDRDIDRAKLVFPVSDVSMRFGIEPEAEGIAATGTLVARGREFRCVVGDGRVAIEQRMAPAASGDAGGPWSVVDEAAIQRPLRRGRVTNVEFWHVDQALWLFLDGDLVCGGRDAGAYGLTPAERVEASTGRTLAELMEINPNVSGSAFADVRIYREPRVRWEFAGGPFTLHRVGLDRDLHYQSGRAPTLGAHPAHPALLGPEDYMMCGDNSANSLDSRYWNVEYPWITETVHGGEARPGLVHRDLLIGRAFVVYLPSPLREGPIPMFDFSHMRWIW